MLGFKSYTRNLRFGPSNALTSTETSRTNRQFNVKGDNTMKKLGLTIALSIASIMLFSSTAIAEKKVMPREVISGSEMAKCARLEARHAHGHGHLHACRNHHHYCVSNIFMKDKNCGIISNNCEKLEGWLKGLEKDLKHCKDIKL